MTKVLCFEGRKGFVIAVMGHAGYAEKGSDIVCAGVSALCQAVNMTLTEYKSEGIFKEYSCMIDDALFCVKVGKCRNESEFCILKAVFNMFYNGIYEIANNYKDFVKLLWCSEASFGKLTDNGSPEQTVLDFFKKEVD